MLNKFRGVTPDVIILIVLVAILVWMGAFLHPEPAATPDFSLRPMPLYNLLLSVIGFNPTVNVVAAFLLLLLTAFLLVNFNTSVFFIGERTFLPALIYILFSGLFPEQQQMNPVLPAAVFFIMALRKIIDSYKIQGTAYILFDAGFLMSIGSLFYANFIWFVILLFIGIAQLRPVNLKEIVISMLGLATPWFLVSGFYYVTGKNLAEFSDLVRYNLFEIESIYVFSRVAITVLIINGIILIISFADLISRLNTKKIRSRKTFILLTWSFLTAIAVMNFSRTVSVEISWLAAIPACYVMSHYFVFAGKKRTVPVIYFLILFIATALIQVLHFI